MYLVNYIHLENVKYLQKRLNAGSDEENSSKSTDINRFFLVENVRKVPEISNHLYYSISVVRVISTYSLSHLSLKLLNITTNNF